MAIYDSVSPDAVLAITGWVMRGLVLAGGLAWRPAWRAHGEALGDGLV